MIVPYVSEGILECINLRPKDQIKYLVISFIKIQFL
jgi:hypothetical protein